MTSSGPRQFIGGVVISIIAIILLNGCRTSTPPVEFYTLTPVIESSEEKTWQVELWTNPNHQGNPRFTHRQLHGLVPVKPYLLLWRTRLSFMSFGYWVRYCNAGAEVFCADQGSSKSPAASGDIPLHHRYTVHHSWNTRGNHRKVIL